MMVRRVFEAALAATVLGMAACGSGPAAVVADAALDLDDVHVRADAESPGDASCSVGPGGGYDASWDDVSPAGPTLAELRSFVAGEWRGSWSWQLPDPKEIQVTGIVDSQTQVELHVEGERPWRGCTSATAGFDGQVSARTTDGGLNWSTLNRFENQANAPSVVSSSGVDSENHAGDLRVAKTPTGTFAGIKLTITATKDAIRLRAAAVADWRDAQTTATIQSVVGQSMDLMRVAADAGALSH